MQFFTSLLYGFQDLSKTKARAAYARRQASRRPLNMERLESRYALAAVTAPLASLNLDDSADTSAPRLMDVAQSQMGPQVNFALTKSINDRVVDFLQNKIGERVGSGECSDVATEALRVAGAKFTNIAPDSPNSGDYVWGNLVTKVEYKGGKAVYSDPANPIRPGDVIQYHNATFSNGKQATHHTAVVAAVDSHGRPSAVFEQNIGKLTRSGNLADRTVHRSSINLSTLTGGWVRIYHPIARTTEAGHFEFTIVNNTSASRTVTETYGHSTSSITLTKGNTSGSHRSAWVTYTGATRPTLTINGKSVTIQNGAGYEIYTMSNGSVSIRKLAS